MEWHCVKLDVKAFAVGVCPGSADASPEAFAVVEVTHLIAATIGYAHALHAQCKAESLTLANHASNDLEDCTPSL